MVATSNIGISPLTELQYVPEEGLRKVRSDRRQARLTFPTDGSVMGPLHAVSEYAIQWIKKMQNENLRSWVPKQEVTDQFNEHVQVRPRARGISALHVHN